MRADFAWDDAAFLNGKCGVLLQGIERMRASGWLAADVLAYAGTLVKVPFCPIRLLSASAWMRMLCMA